MMTNPKEKESESQQIESLEKEIIALRAEQTLLQDRIKHLLLTEDLVAGVTYPKEIFTLQQDKLRLDTEIQFLQVRIRRLKASW